VVPFTLDKSLTGSISATCLGYSWRRCYLSTYQTGPSVERLAIHYSKFLNVAVTPLHKTGAILTTQVRIARVTRK